MYGRFERLSEGRTSASCVDTEETVDEGSAGSLELLWRRLVGSAASASDKWSSSGRQEPELGHTEQCFGLFVSSCCC